jgi:NitT/TauT family transport system ATP-binding protein
MLTAENVSKTYRNGTGREIAAIEYLDFEISPAEFVCILGSSGCGKTTTHRLIAGLEKPSSGHIRLNGRKITGPGPERCVVFQQYTLFPWRPVLKNIAFGLEMQGMKKSNRGRIAKQYLELVGLGGFGHAYPYELSGGMQQRVAVARALAANPRILLMDEPFGALDAQTRRTLQNELIRIWQRSEKTILFVTHSVNEAVFLADRIIVMKSNPGRISAVIENPLPRPRQENLASTRDFRETVRQRIESSGCEYA